MDASHSAPPARTPRPRNDGWTAVRQAHFLDLLAATRSVTKAARGVGMSRESAHRLRARDPHGLFAILWDRCFTPPIAPPGRAQLVERHKQAVAAACCPSASAASDAARPSTS